jgi:hypothetical protein
LPDHPAEDAVMVLSQSSILGQNPKIGCQELNGLQMPTLSKKQLCDRTFAGTSLLTKHVFKRLPNVNHAYFRQYQKWS